MHSLRVKLILPFVIGTLILTVLLAWYTYSSARQAVEDAVILISETKTNNASSSMTLLFKSMTSTIQNMVVDPHVTTLFTEDQLSKEAKKEAANWLEIITQSNDYYRDILIIDKNGICIASSNPGHIGDSFADKPYIQQALQGIFNFGEPSVGRVTRKFSAFSAAPIDIGEGVVGALVVINDFPEIVNYDIRPGYDSQTVFTALLSSSGIFAAHKNMEVVGNEALNFSSLYEQLSGVGEKGGIVEYTMFGRRYIGYARVEPISKWVVISSGVYSEVFAPAYRVGLVVFGISLIFLCVISFVVIRLANGILSSLLSLIRYAKDVSEGDLEQRLAPTNRKDELGILHNALQRLVSSLRNMLEKTQEASKMKGLFLANMSHEIRTPLNAILGMVHLSLRDGNLSEKNRNYLDKIQLAAKSLLGVINDILDFSKVEAGMLSMEHVSFNLRETLENTLDIHQETANTKSIGLSLDYAASTPEYFIGDPLRIGQILNNLLSNALKFTKQGDVSVRCWQESEQHNDTLSETSPPVDILYISVTDTGIGIAEDVLATLFQPFTQADASTSRQFGGTGLGLTISDRLVALMGGVFTVRSKPGQGTTFQFSLKLERTERLTSEKEDELPLDIAFERLNIEDKRILVAEDNEINQMIIEELLSPSKAKVTLVNNGQEAVDAVKERTFDLVLMDMQMPIMDGLEATRIIRTFDMAKDLPIIAVTANAMEEDKDRGLACGMNDYLTKPIEPKELLRMLHLWLGQGRKV